MPTKVPSGTRRAPLLALAAALVLLGVAAVVAGQLFGWERLAGEVRRTAAAGFTALAAAGPAAYFGAMALLPLAGCPVSPFALAAGPLFGERLGTPLLLLCGVAAITTNVALAYGLARRWLRPPLARLVARLGYRLPEAAPSDATSLIVLVRVTPGPPFFVQNYLLGLAGVPFGRYLAISAAVQGGFGIAFMLFGEAVSQGRGRAALLAAGLLAALLAGLHLARRHLKRGRA